MRILTPTQHAARYRIMETKLALLRRTLRERPRTEAEWAAAEHAVTRLTFLMGGICGGPGSRRHCRAARGARCCAPSGASSRRSYRPSTPAYRSG